MTITLRPSFKSSHSLRQIRYMFIAVSIIIIGLIQQNSSLRVFAIIIAIIYFLLPALFNLKNAFTYKIQIENLNIILKYEMGNIEFPFDVDGNPVSLPGLKFERNTITEFIYIKDKRNLQIPFNHLTGIWVEQKPNGDPFVMFGTAICKYGLSIDLFGKERLFTFLKNYLPKYLFDSDRKWESIIYKCEQAYLENIHQTKKEETTGSTKHTAISWILFIFISAIFLGIPIWGILNDGFTKSNILILIFYGTLLVISFTTIFFRKQSLTVNDVKIVVRTRKNTYQMYWKEVTHISFEQKKENFIFYGKNKKLVVRKPLADQNKFLWAILKVKMFEGNIGYKKTKNNLWQSSNNTEVLPSDGR